MIKSQQKHRIWLATALWNVFKDFYDNKKWNENKKFLINIPDLNIELKSLTVTTRSNNSKKRRLISTVNNENWLDDKICNELRKILNTNTEWKLVNCIWTNTKNKSKYIKFLNPQINEGLVNASSKEFREKLSGYKKLRTSTDKRAYLAGLRKLIEQHRSKIDEIFNTKWIDLLLKDFNSYDINHSNLIGEEKITKSGFKKKCINPEIAEWTDRQFIEKCDELYHNVDSIYFILENNKKI